MKLLRLEIDTPDGPFEFVMNRVAIDAFAFMDLFARHQKADSTCVRRVQELDKYVWPTNETEKRPRQTEIVQPSILGDPMKFTDSGSNFELPPAGAHAARLYAIIDLGTQPSTWQGKTSSSRKVMLQFELDEMMSSGRPFQISRRFTASLGQKAKLREFLEQWRGKSYSDQEAREGFEASRLLGTYALLNLVEDVSDRGSYMNIASVAPLPKQMPKFVPVNETLLFDLGDPSGKVFDGLSERVKATIAQSPEYAAWQGKARSGGAFDDLKDDLPWEESEVA